MSIRVSKHMGYGLGDIQVHDYQLIDPRFKKLDPDAGIDGAIQDAAKKVHHMCKDIHAHEKEFNDIICSVSIPPSRIRDFSLGILPIILPKLKKPNFSCVHFDPEFGLKKVMLFQPLEYPDWSRHDDPIDYYENEGKPKVRVLPNSLYPWDGIEHIPGTPFYTVEGEDVQKLGGGDYNELVGRWDKRLPAFASGEQLAILLNNYRPIIPQSILLTTYYANIFIDWAATVNQLRPMIYTYWS